MSMREKRKHKRYDVKNVRGGLAYSLDVNVLDFSMGGMRIETGAYLRVGSRHDFNLQHDDKTLTLSGTVSWCMLKKVRHNKEDKALPIYHAGIEFKDVVDHKSLLLRKLIEQKAAVQIERRIYVRFKLQSGSKASLCSHAKFQVLKISLSGMLIETDFFPESNAVLSFEVQLEDTVLSTSGRIVHAESMGRINNQETVHVGIEFADLSDQEKAELEKYLGHGFDSGIEESAVL